MPKPYVAKSSKTMKLKSGPKTYSSWAVRVTIYDKTIGGVKSVHLVSIGSKPVVTESKAREIAKEFGPKYGFTLADLRAVKRLKIIEDEELEADGGERNSRTKTRGAVKK